jgi:hypothetical protein
MSTTTNTRDWKFYTAIVAGIALAGTGIFLISSHSSYLYQKNRLKADNTTLPRKSNLIYAYNSSCLQFFS